MKLLSKVGMALVVTALIAFASCQVNVGGNNDPDPNPSPPSDQVDFTNHQGTAAAFRVRNDSNQRLVAFRNSVSIANLLGGIEAGAQNHGIRNNAQLFTQVDAFPVVLVTYEQFRDAGGANATPAQLGALNQNPFTRIFVVFNPNADPEAPVQVYTIDGSLGGDSRLTISNPSDWDVEIRRGGREGETLAFVTGGMQSTTILVQPGDYDLYPVITRFNRARGTIHRIHPRHPVTGILWSTSIGVRGPGPYTFNLNEAVNMANDIANMSIGMAWLAVNNQGAAAIRLIEGAVIATDSLGFSLINQNDTRTIGIEMPSVGNAFASHRSIASYRVRMGGFDVPITFTGEYADEVAGDTETSLRGDHLYVLTIEGSHVAGDVTAVINRSQARRITLADLDLVD